MPGHYQLAFSPFSNPADRNLCVMAVRAIWVLPGARTEPWTSCSFLKSISDESATQNQSESFVYKRISPLLATISGSP